MCGIGGFFAPGGQADVVLENVARDMAQRMMHRGPDDGGVWTDPSSGLALAHRRLAIMDLSSAGHQPMTSSCGRYVIIFNGEIYNHLAMREELAAQGYAQNMESWRGHSDTETLLTAIAVWGMEEALQKAVGMFALALWDRQEKTLSLARDRMGEKPLYYGLHEGALLFASELKALYAYPRFKGEIDRQALALFLRRNTIPAPYSVYRGIFKLPPGTWLEITLQDIANRKLAEPKSFWSLRTIAEQGQAHMFQGGEPEAVEELERLLRQSIAGQMLSDVPLGAFLSGGIDSSTVVALMQAQSSRPVRTFTIGFHEDGYNEAEHARAVASHLGTEHTELYVTPEQAMAIIPRLPALYDEPFADVSQIPTFLISEMARRHVTVCLSGDGGDELFGGYTRYVRGASLWRKLGWLPQDVRTGLSSMLTTVSPAAWDSWFNKLSPLLPERWRYSAPGDKLHKLAEMLAVTSSDEIYASLVAQWRQSENVVLGHAQLITVIPDQACIASVPELEHRMMYLDAVTYLPDDVLVKVDRAAMGVSLETRVPMLDHRVVEYAWSLPLSMKIRGGEGKWLLRQVLDRHVPSALIDRPKTGFAVPLDRWLRGPLSAWAEELLDPVLLQHQGFFDPAAIRMKWKEHLSGKRNWAHQLWSVLMFQAWLAGEGRK